jgi:hypothetical protein
MWRARSQVSVVRVRKGRKASAKMVWRRMTTGSNHISAHGVWRDRARRAAMRVNRTGETRWHHMPAANLSPKVSRERQ